MDIMPFDIHVSNHSPIVVHLKNNSFQSFSKNPLNNDFGDSHRNSNFIRKLMTTPVVSEDKISQFYCNSHIVNMRSSHELIDYPHQYTPRSISVAADSFYTKFKKNNYKPENPKEQKLERLAPKVADPRFMKLISNPNFTLATYKNSTDPKINSIYAELDYTEQMLLEFMRKREIREVEENAELNRLIAADEKAVAMYDSSNESSAYTASDPEHVSLFFKFHNLPNFRRYHSIPRSVLNHYLPGIREHTGNSRAIVLRNKLALCCYVFPESVESIVADVKDRELKRRTMLELIAFITMSKPSFTENALRDIFDMIHINLFRSLKPSSSEMVDSPYRTYYAREVKERTWHQLQVIYEFVLRLATAQHETDPTLLDMFFNQRFVSNLLELFGSEDARERDYLKTILHRIYGNFMTLRPFIRRAINNVLFDVIYRTDKFHGVAELLEIIGSIINGFALPLKEQHKQFLFKVLLPLHKTSGVIYYHGQLCYCITQFLKKDPSLSSRIIDSIVSIWPYTSTKKQVMFLGELEQIFDCTGYKNTGLIANLFSTLVKCATSPYFAISERALFLLGNKMVVRTCLPNKEVVIPIVIRGLLLNIASDAGAEGRESHERYHLIHTNGEYIKWLPGTSTRTYGHWHSDISELSTEIIRMYVEIDTPYAESLKRDCEENPFEQFEEAQQFNYNVSNWLRQIRESGSEVWSTIEEDDHKRFLKFQYAQSHPPYYVHKA